MSDQTKRALDILAKWRVLLTGWQLGTRPKGDPEGDAVRNHREATILLRAEVTALTGLLLAKGIIAEPDWDDMLHRAAVQLNEDFEHRFPGVTASEDGLHMDKRVLAWMKGWKP